MLEICSYNSPFFYGHYWPCGPFYTLTHTQTYTHKHTYTHTDKQTTTVEKCLGDLWKTWKIHFNNTSNTETLITGPLKGFKFQHAVSFLDKACCHNPPSGPWLKQPGDTAANHKQKMRNRTHKCASHASGSKSWFDLNYFWGGIFCTSHAEYGLASVFPHHQHVSEIFVLHLGLVAHRSLRRGKSYIHTFNLV